MMALENIWKHVIDKTLVNMAGAGWFMSKFSSKKSANSLEKLCPHSRGLSLDYLSLCQQHYAVTVKKLDTNSLIGQNT